MTDNALTCRYHPRIPARWYCPECNINFCSGCAKTNNNSQAFCPSCKGLLDSHGVAHLITPFWRKLHSFFLYPINTQTLLYIAFITLITAATNFVPMFGWLLGLVIWLAFMKYFYDVIGQMALGHETPPRPDWKISTDGMSMPIKQYGIFIAMGLTFVMLGGGFLSIAAMIMMYLALPATAMIIATEDSLIRALNPVLWFRIIGRIGLPYLVLYGFLILLSGASAAVGYFLSGKVSPMIGYFIISASSMYYMLVMAAMIGYTVYQYHEQLNFSVEVDFDQTSDAKQVYEAVNEDPALNQANILIGEGRHDDAIVFLQQAINQEPAKLDLYENLWKLLLLKNDAEKMTGTAEKYIQQLYIDHKYKKVIDVYRESLKAGNVFELKEPELACELAHSAKDMGQSKLALKMINGFGKRFPNSPLIPKVYLLAAKIMCEDMKQDKQALTILTSLMKRYRNDPLFGEIEQYHKFVNGLNS